MAKKAKFGRLQGNCVCRERDGNKRDRKLPKVMKRIKNSDLLKSYRGRKCEVCASAYLTVGHHIKTKGSGGDDVDDNLMALCRKHHKEVHDIGLNKFVKKYPHVRDLIKEKNWEFDEFMNRWVRYQI